MNELLLIGSVIIIYGLVLLSYKLFSKTGLYVMMVISTIIANIEVLILVNAFGLEQTLGNVMFASTYLITDILSENEGKKSASKAVWIGVFTSIVMLVFTQYMRLYIPAESDWAKVYINTIFATTPRLILGSIAGYIVSQLFDVWLYHSWWKFTENKTGNKRKFLWLRNNGSTLISQLLNTIIFTTISFAGWYDINTLINIMISSYVIYIFTSLLDTPAVYIARKMKDKENLKNFS
ncbi:MAG: queuosine precursor transporter [Clostridia bacterium]|nr:queuosine precursor transporter [Clostridia bacterium]